MQQTTQQTPAAQQPAKVVPAPVTEAQANAWVAMARTKNELAARLENAELMAQSILLPAQSTEDYNKIDLALADYRKHHTQMVELRKQFTSQIELGVIQPLMSFEKKVDPKTNELYKSLEAKSLAIKKTEEAKAAAFNRKNQERSAFITHIKNEWLRIQSQYSTMLRSAITSFYAESLKAKVEAPPIKKLEELLTNIPVATMSKFIASQHTNEELMVIYNEQKAPDFQAILADAIQSIDGVFQMYEQDLANAEQAAAHALQQDALRKQEEERIANEQAAMNTLLTTAEVVTVETPKIKRSVKIVVHESSQWAKAVMTNFMLHEQHLAKYIRVKSWSKLSIGQMAEYLSKYASDTGEVFNGVEFEEVEK